jgi:small multidrug resistance pump
MYLNYIYLVAAICVEVVSTTALKSVDGLRKPLPLLVVIIGYSCSFYLLSLVLRSIPIGVAYALWSGVGIVAIAAIGWIMYRQTLDLPACVGIGLIVIGVLTINLFSDSIRR